MSKTGRVQGHPARNDFLRSNQHNLTPLWTGALSKTSAVLSTSNGSPGDISLFATKLNNCDYSFKVYSYVSYVWPNESVDHYIFKLCTTIFIGIAIPVDQSSGWELQPWQRYDPPICLNLPWKIPLESTFYIPLLIRPWTRGGASL